MNVFEVGLTLDNAIALLQARILGAQLNEHQRDELMFMLRFYRVTLECAGTAEANAREALEFVEALRPLCDAPAADLYPDTN